jgi:NAD-dependent dihydropyrimidine dehydrogenase PreA subunit
MDLMKRRAFIKMTAFFGPCVAAGTRELLPAQKKDKEEGLMILIQVCTACGECVEVCPVDAIALKNGKPSLDNSLCIECDSCIRDCPADAILYKRDLEDYKKAHPERFKPDRK